MRLSSVAAQRARGNRFLGRLAAMLAPLIRDMIGAELPVLEANGLSMWGYSVLLALDRSAIRTQAALAEAIGADKTRIIAILDELQQKGWIERVADPDDRRARLLAITEEGRKAAEAVDYLTLIPRKSARLIAKTLRSAIANAENNNNLSADSLTVKSAIVENGPVLKRFKDGARGTAMPRRKKMSHIRIVLSDGNTN